MRSSLVFVCVAIVVLASFHASALSNDKVQLFYNDLAIYFGVDRSIVDDLVSTEIAVEDLAVALFIADQAQIELIDIATFRTQGDSWQGIMSMRNIKTQSLYFMVSGEISDNTFGPIFEKFRNLPENRWNELIFSDAEVINIINLRFVYSHNDYSVFSVMVMRDRDKSFVDINYDVHLAKADKIKRQKAKVREKAKEAAAQKAAEEPTEE